jgi:CubicO group peptidase (beta-lactamase class C family)
MRNTTYTRQTWLDGRIALPHDAQGTALSPPLRDEAVASDDVYSTPSDYAQFLIGAMNGRGLTPALRAERAAVFADRRAELCRKIAPEHCPAEAGMGLGWESFLIDGKRFLMHTGADDGTFTFAYFSPDTRSGVVIFTNSSNGAKVVLPLLRLVGHDSAFVDFLERLVGAPAA